MDDRSRERLKVANVVLKALRSHSFRAVVPDTTPAGERVIIPALEDDAVGQFFDEIRKADGRVYIATLKDGGIRVLSITPAHAPRHAITEPDYCQFCAETQLGMIISYLELQGGPVTFYEAPKNVRVELIEGDDLRVPTPA